MKLILSIILLFIILTTFAQSPEKMSYQAVIRDSNGAILSNQNISIRISVLLGGLQGQTIYTEKHNVITSQSGLISLEIGEGSTSDDFSLIDWSNGSYFLKTEADPNGGTNYSIIGTTQLLSVPYALFSKNAGNFDEVDPIFEKSIAFSITESDTAFWNKKLEDYIETDPVFEFSTASGITKSDTASWNNKLDDYTETDPIFEFSTASGITSSDTASWNNKLDDYTETDPVFESSTASGITSSDTASWNSKLDNYTESQSLNEVLSLGNSANNQIKNLADPTDAQDAATKAYVDLLEKKLEELSDEIAIINGTKIRDIDGNVYNVVQIGSQIWMAENLQVTRYSDGTSIPLVEEATDWNNLNFTDPAYCYYNNDSINYNDIYGALYNWAAATRNSSSSSNPSGIQGVCPTGWHIPSDDEFKELEMYLGMSQAETDGTLWRGTNQGSQLAGNISLWLSGNLTSNSEFGTSGFNAVPAGYRNGSGVYLGIGENGHWRVSDETSLATSWDRDLNYVSSQVYRNDDDKKDGLSLRCIRDQ